jgi:arabinofuranosyltransferase
LVSYTEAESLNTINNDERREEVLHILALTLAMVVFGASVLKLAWVCDDAFITFRTIDNFVNGFGLRWNISERVQTFTHPLWLILLTPAYALFGHIYYVVIAISVALGAGTIWLTSRAFADHWSKTLWIGVVFASSKAFSEYTTSGLEYPLTNFLLVGFLFVFLRRKEPKRRLLLLSILAGLLCLNRLDSVLVVAPALALEFWRNDWRQSWRVVVSGFSPLLVWMAFATVYFGTPFPNTAYAKLSAGVPMPALLEMGLTYYANSFSLDPITIIVVVLALTLVVLTRRPDCQALGAGIVVHGLYVLWIGGDFMSGRFFTSTFVVTVVLICLLLPRNLKQWSLLIATTVLMVTTSPVSPLRVSAASYPDEKGNPEGG